MKQVITFNNTLLYIGLEYSVSTAIPPNIDFCAVDQYNEIGEITSGTTIDILMLLIAT